VYWELINKFYKGLGETLPEEDLDEKIVVEIENRISDYIKSEEALSKTITSEGLLNTINLGFRELFKGLNLQIPQSSYDINHAIYYKKITSFMQKARVNFVNEQGYYTDIQEIRARYLKDELIKQITKECK